MTQRIATDLHLDGTGWQALERTVQRLITAQGYTGVQLVGASGDGGADVIATRGGRRWLFQVKRWRLPVGPDVIAQTVAACRRYDADIPVVVSTSGFDPSVRMQQEQLVARGLKLQLWDRRTLLRQAERVPAEPLSQRDPDRYQLRSYQVAAVDGMMGELVNGARSSLVVLATGLGKTFVAAEFYRRYAAARPDIKALVLAHRNELVYQLERSFWPMLPASCSTGVWNGSERPGPGVLADLDIVFACVDSVAGAVSSGRPLPDYGLVIVDECHHLGTSTYNTVLKELSAGSGGAFLVGMTATPWRPDGTALSHWFDFPIVNVDMVRGLRDGYLANVDYRMYTDNIDWDSLTAGNPGSSGPTLTPEALTEPCSLMSGMTLSLNGSQRHGASRAGREPSFSAAPSTMPSAWLDVSTHLASPVQRSSLHAPRAVRPLTPQPAAASSGISLTAAPACSARSTSSTRASTSRTSTSLSFSGSPIAEGSLSSSSGEDSDYPRARNV